MVDDISRPLQLYYDNEPAVMYAHNNKTSGAAKHIDIKYYVVKDKVRDQIINLEYISTGKMLADPLTKGLPPSVFKEHVAGKPVIFGLQGPKRLKNPYLNRSVYCSC
jgi:hypothetical protein